MSTPNSATGPIQDRLQSDRCARALRALANAERLKLVQCLQQRPHTVTELTERLSSNITKVSHHLSVMRHAGLVHDEKQGKYVVYSLDEKIFQESDKKEMGMVDLGCCRLDLRSGKR